MKFSGWEGGGHPGVFGGGKIFNSLATKCLMYIKMILAYIFGKKMNYMYYTMNKHENKTFSKFI